MKQKHILKSKSFQGIMLLIASSICPYVDKKLGTNLMAIQPYILSLGVTWSGLGVARREDIKIFDIKGKK